MGFHKHQGRSNHHGRGGRGGPIRPIFDEGGVFGEKPDYKTAALCKQVARTVSMALSGECGDPVLQELVVHDVLPAPNAGRLLVRVVLRVREGGPSLIDVLERLERVHGLLRARVSESIVRKRAPELSFDVLLAGGAPREAGDE